MSGNDGSGCAGTILAGVLLALVLAVAVAWTGLPQGNGITWDTSATTERQQTERIRLAEQGRTERERIAADAETSRTWAIALTFMVTVGSTAGAVVAWSRRPHRPVPPTVTMLLPHYPGHVAEFSPVEREWTIVDPRSGEYYTATDARRLLEMRR